MQTTTSSPLVPALPTDVLAPLRDWAVRAAGWLNSRRQAAIDQTALANMSERELLDIGMPVNAMPITRDTWWPADYPR